MINLETRGRAIREGIDAALRANPELAVEMRREDVLTPEQIEKAHADLRKRADAFYGKFER